MDGAKWIGESGLGKVDRGKWMGQSETKFQFAQPCHWKHSTF